MVAKHKRNLVTDMRSPLAKARDDWMLSDEGERLSLGNVDGQYLRNRLEAAFIAGWNARDKQEHYPRLPHRPAA